MEIRALFAQHIMMSCLRLPRVRTYFDPQTNLPFFSKHLSRNRFSALRQNLHVTDVASRRKNCNDRLYKIRPIVNLIRARLHQLPLEENLCVDEQMIPFKGKFVAKQYIKGKPCPWGIKVFFLCGKSGMPYELIIYQGSTTPLNEKLVKSVGFGSAIVLELAKRIPINEVGHRLFFDNYFPSFQLFEILSMKKINAAGTVRANRFANPPLPDAKTMALRGRGSAAECYSENGKVIFTRWFDNKVVNLASNFVGIGLQDNAKRWDKQQSAYVEVKRPEVVRLYNESMGGVDLLDQLIQYYRINIRTSKWTVRAIMHFVDLAIIAAWMEYRKDCLQHKIQSSKILDSYHFRLAVADQLICTEPIESEKTPHRGRPARAKRGPRPANKEKEGRAPGDEEASKTPKRSRKENIPPTDFRQDSGEHLPVFIASKSNARCKMPGCTKKTFIKCNRCGVHLCIKREKNCFFEFHTKKRN